MVIKGKSCGGARRLSIHLLRRDTNERVEVLELRGVAAQNLADALREMEAVASGCRTTKNFYHASMNTRPDERLTAEQRFRAIDRLEKELGLTGQPRAVVLHMKDGREHCHVAWSRIDVDRMTAISDSHNYRKHELVARELEREFGHERVQGAHIEREGRERPARTPSHSEMQQADRTKLSPQEVRQHITEIWQRTDNGRTFAAAVFESGYALAPGDRRDFVVVDPKGGIHSLARCVVGGNTKQVRERMADVDPRVLPTIARAKALMRLQEVERGPALQQLDDSEKLKRSGLAGQEWTDGGGMVEQQRAAADWIKQAAQNRHAGLEQTERLQAKPGQTRERDDATRRREALSRTFSREIDKGPDRGGHDPTER